MTTATRSVAPPRGGVALEALHQRSEAVVERLRSPASAGRMVRFAIAAFAVLALLAAFAEPLLLTVDTNVQATVISLRTPWLDEAMKALTFLGTRWVTGLVTVLVAAWSLRTGRGRAFALVMAAAFLVNPVFEIGFKELVGRARPGVARLLPGNGPSFPSGHVLASVGTFGLLPLLVWEETKSILGRVAAWLGSLGVIAVVAGSRVYLDVHWTTDVAAGLLLGSVLVITSYQARRWAGVAPPDPGEPATANIGVASGPRS